jgi:hypothetical protein
MMFKCSNVDAPSPATRGAGGPRSLVFFSAPKKTFDKVKYQWHHIIYSI